MSQVFRTPDPPSITVVNQIPEILRQVGDARDARQDHCVHLLDGLTPLLVENKISERIRKRLRAPRFNPLKYFHAYEDELSKLIADLLNPLSEHGQRASFLEAMLEFFPRETKGWPDELQAVADSIRVGREHSTPEGRYIDIIVDIPSPTENHHYCLAFENKPYADDEEDQIKDYLKYLKKKYGKRFLLIYLPPVYREPSEYSCPKEKREKYKAKGNFRVMPYVGGDLSLTKWFAKCRKECGAKRVRGFLKDAEGFCQQKFGENKTTMSNNPDVRFVRDYLSKNPGQLHAALAVHGAWPLVRDDICKRFLEHLCKAVNDRLHKDLAHIAPDCNVWYHYEGERRYSNVLSITRDDWVQYEDIPPGSDKCTRIKIQSHGLGPNDWIWGVCSPKPMGKMNEEERKRRENLSSALERRGLRLAKNNDWWPQYDYPSRYQKWNTISPELTEECERGGGPITKFYVDGLFDIARFAIPAINEVEIIEQADSHE